MFIKIKNCPFCGSRNSNSIINKDLINNFYVREIVSDLKITFNLLRKKLKIRRCENCKSVFFSVWFNNFFKKKIFLSVYGQHNMGWQNFHDFKKKLVTPNHGNLFKDLKKFIKFKSYGEYGCPFNGLMFDLLKEEIRDTSKLRKYLNLNMKSLSNKVRDFNKKKIVRKKSISIPNVKRIYQKYFVIDSSFLIWGKNDISENCSSLSLADKIFNFDLYDSQEKELTKKKIDLFGLFMTLDHCEQPLELLKKILKISRYVIIHAHTNVNITAQHSFVFTKNIKFFLKKIGIHNVDITDTILKDVNRNKGLNYKTDEIYLLCSRIKNNIEKYNI